MEKKRTDKDRIEDAKDYCHFLEASLSERRDSFERASKASDDPIFMEHKHVYWFYLMQLRQVIKALEE